MIPSIKQALTLPIPLTLAAHHNAQLFYQRYPFDPHKAKQVYLNTLAVEAISTYLDWMGIECDPQASSSWDPIVQTLADVADLVIPGQGKLECRPVLPEATTFYIPPEASADRIGYLPVRFNLALTTATLLGFMPGESIHADIAVETNTVPLDSLRPIALLFDYVQVRPNLSKQHTVLGQWLKGAVESDWQTVEAIMEPLPNFSFRNVARPHSAGMDGAVVRGKLIASELPSTDWKSPAEDIRASVNESRTVALSEYQAILIVSIEPNDSLQLNVRIKLCPTVGDRYLPENLEFRILDAQGTIVMEALARQANALQLDFRAIASERFTVEVSLNGVTLAENFVI